MLSDFLKQHITSQASYVEFGYGQVEPNHLSAQRTSQVYAQLPAAADISVLEQGQFVKYDYANGVVNFSGPGEWMLVYNELKLYRDNQSDCEFAMVKDNYQARVYSPSDGADNMTAHSRYYNGVDASGASSITVGDNTYNYDDVTAANDPYELHYNSDPYHIVSKNHEQMMPAGTSMIPRVFKTNVGDIYTTNMVAGRRNEAQAGAEHVIVNGDILVPGATGILEYSATPEAGSMQWQVVKVYTMPDHQKGIKLMRIA